MPVRVITLGTLRIELDGDVLDRLPSARNRSALLVHLAVEREVTRDAAMDLIWPDRPPERARHLLSQTLYELRQELGDHWMDASGERILATDALQADACDFERAVDAGEFERALSLYQGRFLPGSGLAVSRPMEGWIDAQQARLGRLHRRARRGALDALAAAGSLREALALAREWVEVDPLDDEAQHRLIELLAATGDRSGALRQYDRYARLVESELELEPLDQTQELVERIRQGDVGRQPPAVEEPPPEPAAPAVADPAAADAVEAPAASTSVPVAAQPTGSTSGTTSAGVDAFLDRMAGLRHRRTVQWTLTYLAGAVVLLEGLDILTDTFGLPPGLLRTVAMVLALGSIVVLGTSWYLTDRRRQFGKPEAALTLLVAIFLLSLPTWFRRASTAEAVEAGLDPNRIAVLYFDDLSRDQDLDPLARGFTEALIHELSQVEGLDVLSRRAVAPFREDPTLPYDSLVSALGAGTLVEGSLARLDRHIRLTIQLIDGETAAHLMSTTLQSAADSTDVLLEGMPRAAARLLRKRLGDWVRLRERETAASSARALELVQRAEALVEDAYAVRASDLDAALPLLERADSMLAEAEKLDPDWPQPPLARVRVEEIRALATSDVPSQYAPEAVFDAFAHLDRVLERWPDYPPALAYRGNLRYGLAETPFGEETEVMEMYAQAEADLRRAIALDETLTEAWWGLSKLLYHLGEDAEAHRAAVRAIETDAFLTSDIDNLWHIFLVALESEDHVAARHWCDELATRFGDTQTYPYCELYLLTSSPRATPDVDRAWRMAGLIVDRATEASRDIYSQAARMQVAKVLVRAGQPDSARAVVARTLPDSVPAWATYDVAHFHLLLGEDDSALDLLDRWTAYNPVRARRLAHDWWFERLRGDPRFDRLVGRGPG